MKKCLFTTLIIVVGHFNVFSQCNTALIISQGRPAFASSQENATYPPGNAFDGDRTTRWSSAFSDPQYLYVDLGAVMSLCQVNLIWESAYGKDFTIDISDDTVSWTTVATITGNTSLINNISISGNGRYVRMNGMARGTPNGYSLFGMHVYGTAPSPSCVGTDLALGGTAVSSSDESIAFPAFQAFDGDGSTRWSSQVSDPQFIYVDLGDIYDLCNVQLTWEAAYASDYHIDVSQDALNWATLTTITGNTSTLNVIPVSGLARYVRMFGTARATGYGYSLYEFTVNGYVTLPVTWVGFDAMLRDNNRVLLNWSTAQEVNNDHFSIERSSGGLPFSAIGSVKAKGNSAVETSYTWTDTAAAPGIDQYRIRQVDLDGRSTFTRILSVNVPEGRLASISVYPNPAVDHVIVSAGGSEKIESIRIYSVTGVLMMDYAAGLASSVNLKVGSLPAGVYNMRVSTTLQSKTIKFVRGAF